MKLCSQHADIQAKDGDMMRMKKLITQEFRNVITANSTPETQYELYIKSPSLSCESQLHVTAVFSMYCLT